MICALSNGDNSNDLDGPLTRFSQIFSFIYLHLYIFICLLTSDEPIWYKLPSQHCMTYEFWQVKHTRNSAIADKPRDAFRDQSRSSNMVPFDMFISACFRNCVRKTRRFSDIRLQNAVTLKTGLRVQEGNWKCHHSVESLCLPVDVL